MDAIAPPDSLIAIHATAGLIAMLAPLVAILTPKPLISQGFPSPGRYLHRGAGLIYVLAMLVLSATAVPLAFYQWNSILLIVLFLSFYLTLSAMLQIRFPEARRLRASAAILLDASAGLVLAFSLFADALPTSLLTTAFSIAAMALGTRDFLSIVVRKERFYPRGWLVSHMARMLASFTLTVTVYSILNFEAVDMLWRCVLPIAAGGLLSAALMKYYLRSR